MPSPAAYPPAQGAYTTLNALIELRFAARSLSLLRPRRALSTLAGPNKSNFRGRGIEFEEVRNYQSGDDIRSIDWRVTARTGTAHTKLFREERERPVLIVVDQRSGMFFGSSHCCKSVLGAHLAALLAWAALGDGDRVGGLVFNNRGHRDIRPRRSRKTVLALLSEVHDYQAALPLRESPDDQDFAAMLGKLRRVARPGSSVFLISDFAGAEAPRAREQWYELAKHTELTALACNDPLEAELPPGGTYAVTDGHERSELRTGERELRRRYRERFQQRRDALTSELARLGIPLLAATTDSSPQALLLNYFGGRRR